VTSGVLRRAAWATGILIFAGIIVLAVDWGIAARRALLDDRIVKELQIQVKESAAVAPKLEAEQKRITDARRARRTRDRAIAWSLAVCAAIFLASMKRLTALGGRKPVEMSTIVAVRAATGKKLKVKGKGRGAPTEHYRINDNCIGCTLCAQVCPVKAIAYRPYEQHEVDDALCLRCDICKRVCQDEAVEVVEG
jgi:ferredoxin